MKKIKPIYFVHDWGTYPIEYLFKTVRRKLNNKGR